MSVCPTCSKRSCIIAHVLLFCPWMTRDKLLPSVRFFLLISSVRLFLLYCGVARQFLLEDHQPQFVPPLRHFPLQPYLGWFCSLGTVGQLGRQHVNDHGTPPGIVWIILCAIGNGEVDSIQAIFSSPLVSRTLVLSLPLGLLKPLRVENHVNPTNPGRGGSRGGSGGVTTLARH